MFVPIKAREEVDELTPQALFGVVSSELRVFVSPFRSSLITLVPVSVPWILVSKFFAVFVFFTEKSTRTGMDGMEGGGTTCSFCKMTQNRTFHVFPSRFVIFQGGWYVSTGIRHAAG